MNLFFQLVNYLLEYPFLLLTLAAVPLVGLARWAGVFPTRRMLWVATIPVLGSLTVASAESLLPWILGLDILILIGFTIDLALIVNVRQFQVKRTLQKVMSLGKPQVVELELTNRSRQRCRVEIVDDLPEDFSADPKSTSLLVQPQSRVLFNYRIKSEQRGLFDLRGTHIKVTSRLGYWNAYRLIVNPAEVHVYPDLKQLAEYGILARTNRLSLLGVRRTRRIGQDNDFERLRDYTRDDNHRHIDWRATARKRKLMVKDFQATQNQSLLFMIDCGRMMTGQSGPFSLLDHALNAMLLMSYVALKQGDSVGVLMFSDRIHSYTPPKSGSRQINRLLHVAFNRHAEYVESRFDEAFVYLNKHCRKRSLVVLMTNLIDEVNSQQVSGYLKNLTGQHLPLACFLRDHGLFSPVDEFLKRSPLSFQANSESKTALFEAAAAADIIKWRHDSIAALVHAGVLCLDTFPEQLTATLVNRYLEIKARHLL